MISLWFASLAALVAQRAAVVGFEREEHGIVVAIPGSLLAVGFAPLLVGR